MSSFEGGGTFVIGQLSIPLSAIHQTFSASSGPGGQHVNKTASKAELRVALADVFGLTDVMLVRLRVAAGRRLTDDGELVIVCQRHRSQHKNREEAFDKLQDLLWLAQREPKKRHATRPTRQSRERRMQSKVKRGEIKKSRRKFHAD